MPWTGEQFASRHNHKLKGASADKAARQANAMLRAGVPEGEAIATANKHANKSATHKGKTKVAKLTPKERANAGVYGGPGKKYPMPDKKHAAIAKGFAAMHHAPNEAAIDAKADKVLGKGKDMKKMEHYAKGGTGPRGHSGGEARAKEMGSGHFASNAKGREKGDGMRHEKADGAATGPMASRVSSEAKGSRFDRMSGKSGSSKY